MLKRIRQGKTHGSAAGRPTDPAVRPIVPPMCRARGGAGDAPAAADGAGIALGLTLAAISVGALILLLDRQAFAYRPFGTGASLAALAVVVAWAIAGRAAARTRYRQAAPVRHDRRALLSAAWAVSAFVWIRTELARAIAPDIATFLLISFYALSGVGAIFLGRVRRRPVVRRIGLALAIYAAIKALIQATEFGAIGLRVGSFLVVGGFLLAVAYWYRASGPNAAEASTP